MHKIVNKITAFSQILQGTKIKYYQNVGKALYKQTAAKVISSEHLELLHACPGDCG